MISPKFIFSLRSGGSSSRLFRTLASVSEDHFLGCNSGRPLLALGTPLNRASKFPSKNPAPPFSVGMALRGLPLLRPRKKKNPPTSATKTINPIAGTAPPLASPVNGESVCTTTSSLVSSVTVVVSLALAKGFLIVRSSSLSTCVVRPWSSDTLPCCWLSCPCSSFTWFLSESFSFCAESSCPCNPEIVWFCGWMPIYKER